ncbi:MAG TPA: glycosyltransferase family 2 protein [Gemmatimonadales bacterium]|nr:glycosyltransferase family 2 protein [Gemmatimonadales bacterium]
MSPDRLPLISVVAPCHNEELNLEPLYWALSSALRSPEWSYELVLVDDGSTDGTWPTISRIARNDSRVHGIRLARSFGQQAAILAGLKQARGDAVVTMDADLQHPPALIPIMVRHWLAGKPVVLTRRTDSDDVGRFKRLTSAVFYRIFSALTGVAMPAGTGEFRLIDRRVVDYLLGLREGEYFLRGLIGWTGFRSVTVPFHAAPRLAGRTKYSLRKMLRLAVSGVTAFSLTPLRIGTVLGLATAFLAFVELGYVLIQVARGHTVPGWASDVGVTTLLFGVQFILLGLIGEYLGRVYLAAKARPPFLVEATTDGSAQFRAGSSDRRKSLRERRRRPMSP